MELKISIRGIEETIESLRALPDHLRVKYGKTGMEKGADLVTSAVKERMPVASGLARESIGHSPIKVYDTSGTLFTAIEAQKGFNRIITAHPFFRNKEIHDSKTTSVSAALARVQNPRKYMHLIEGGRQAVIPTNKKALHSALDTENRFFMHAKSVMPHPVFEPAFDATEIPVVAAVENELRKGIEAFNQTNNTMSS